MPYLVVFSRLLLFTFKPIDVVALRLKFRCPSFVELQFNPFLITLIIESILFYFNFLASIKVCILGGTRFFFVFSNDSSAETLPEIRGQDLQTCVLNASEWWHIRVRICMEKGKILQI